MENEIERKSIQVEFKEASPGSFIAQIAQFDVMDADGDVTLPGAFPKGKNVLVSAYQHGSWMGALPVGKAVIDEVGEFAIGNGQFNLASDSGKEHYETVKFSAELQEWSYGFKVLEMGSEEEMDAWAAAHDGARPARILKKVDPFEISPVLKGAGVGTATLAIKGNPDAEGSTYADQAEAVLAAAEDLIARTKSLADLRRKDGRELSISNRDRIKKLHASIEDMAKDLKQLLESTEPMDKDAVLKLQAEFTKIESEILEVSLP